MNISNLRALLIHSTALALLLLACSCSSNQPYRFDTLAPRVESQGFGKVVVVTRDSRAGVLRGDEKPQQVGSVEGISSDTHPIQTASGKPFAQDVSTAVCNSLIGRGYECLPLMSGSADVEIELDYLLQTHHPVRILFFTLSEFDAHTYMSSTLKYDLSLKVFNPMLDTMASVGVKGSDRLGNVGSLNPARHSSKAVPRALEDSLEKLLNHPKVIEALNMYRPIDALGARYR